MVEAGIPIEFSKGEAGIGQHEINITYGGALEAADRHLVFKNGVKEIASGFGRAATFMAKWSMELRRLLLPPPRQSVGRRSDVRSWLRPRVRTPPGYSTVGAQFVAGQLFTRARQLAWCFAPYVNSYRRYVPDSWAPTAMVWGEDNRTCGFRAVGAGRPGGSSAGSRAPTSTRTWPWPPPSPAGCGASSTSSSWAPPSPATPTTPPPSRIPTTLVEASTTWPPARWRPKRSGPRSTITC